MPSLEQDFNRAMVGIYESQKDYGYYATYFKQMRRQPGWGSMWGGQVVGAGGLSPLV